MRNRILIAIGGSLVVMLLALSLASRVIVTESNKSLEARYVRRDIQRVQAGIAAQVTALGATVADYATWNDMYFFRQHPTREFSSANFSDSAAENLSVNIVAVLDPRGAVVFEHGVGTGDRVLK